MILSICIPTYNRASYLINCLQSIIKSNLNSNYDIQVCISDNHSTDNTENIIKNANDIADKGIKEIVITGVNIGEFKDKNDNRSHFFSNTKMNLNLQEFSNSSLEINYEKKHSPSLFTKLSFYIFSE